MTYLIYIGLGIWYILVLGSIILVHIYLKGHEIIQYLLYVAITILAPNILFTDWWMNIFR